MYINNKILMAKNNEKEYYILPKMANRHGIIAGSTGSGKTVTLKVMAESFSNCGTSVFLSDVKGDLSGMCLEGIATEDIKKRIEKFNLENVFKYQKFPTEFFDIMKKKGMPIRTTITEFGPVLLSYILELNDVQSDVINVIFKISDDSGLLLIDLKDLKSLLNFVSEHTKDLSEQYGNISKATITSILRSLISLEQQGIENLFGEPAFDILDFFRCNEKGQGYINILNSESLIMYPKIYEAFMLWLLSTLYEKMPEVGDIEKPKIVFFFDEAHLLFKDASKNLLKKIEQITKLIRSKGIGIYFITQDPTDIPNTVLQQLGNKIQHVYRAYTAKDKKNLNAIVDSFRENEKIDLTNVLQNLGTGEACVSFLDENGVPSEVDVVKIVPPESKMGTITDDERKNAMNLSNLYNKYSKDIDRESAYEMLSDTIKKQEMEKVLNINEETVLNKRVEEKIKQEKEKDIIKERTKKEKSMFERNINSTTRSIAGSVGREVGNVLAETLFSGNKTLRRVAGNSGAAIFRGLMGTFSKR